MGNKTLDRNRRYGMVYGDEVEKFYQDGCFFNGRGEFVRTKDGKPGKAPAERPESLKEAVAPTAPSDPVPSDDRAEKLQKLHISKLKKLAASVAEQAEVELPEIAGAGAKPKWIKWILDNTE